jgi:flagellar export protein FliJ
MKRFHFRAATVLNLRKRQYDMAQVELARVQRERDTAGGAVRDAEDALSRAEGEYRERLVMGGEACALERHRYWITRQHAGAESCRRRLTLRQLEVERATADVRRTHRQSRVLERLRDRAWRDYREEARRQEALEIDQLAVIQYARRMGGGTDHDD